MAKLTVYTKDSVPGSLTVRCEVEKWEFQDKAMGEQYIMFSTKSHVPIPFSVGDWCEFRGQRYTLNVEPSCTQKARPWSHGEAFTYESVKLDSPQDDLTRCTILDVIPTSGEHSAAYGTNYTGSANFTLNCFETTFVYQGNTIYYAPVHAILDRIKANLDRLYGDPVTHENEWHIYIDDEKCHSDDKIITFANWTAAQALAEVHNTFKLDYTVRGRNILVGDVSGLDLPAELEGANGYVTDLDDQDDPLFFGYGMGYLSEDNQGKSLFQIKKLSKSDQQIVTRLRAMGSTKNMPYRYYHKHYDLPQTMYVQNLQLPDTFVPYDENEDLPENTNVTYYKVTGNAERDGVYGEGVLRHVLGKSNDAYIDKNDDAASCPEGIREGTARWDGSDGDLPEIYPTIEEATYSELRAAGVPDIDGNTGSGAYPHYLPYGDVTNVEERIDEILAVGNDCNIGNGVMTESEAFGTPKTTVMVQMGEHTGALANTGHTFNIWEITDIQAPGDYIMSYTIDTPEAYISVNPGQYGGGDFFVAADVTVVQKVYEVPVDGSAGTAGTLIATNTSTGRLAYASGSYGRATGREYSVKLADFHNTETEWSTPTLTLSKNARVYAQVSMSFSGYSTSGTPDFSQFTITFGIRKSTAVEVNESHLVWQPSSSGLYYSSTPFHLTLKDIGVNFRSLSAIDGGDIVISMKSGQCAGREFAVKAGGIKQEPDAGNARKGWTFELDRVNDESIHAYFPSEKNKILPGDQYVLLNIELPDSYIKAAEVRLLKAATEHLADNCDTQYTYQPSVDDIYLQRNIDFHANDPENSVFWRLYAGMKFPFFGIPKNEGDPLPVADITIESVSIKMGEKPTPQVDITLNEKLQQSSIQRIQTTVDRLYGSVFSYAGNNFSTSNALTDYLIQTLGSKYFLSKNDEDTASRRITFTEGVSVKNIAEIENALIGGVVGSPTFRPGITGEGWEIDSSTSSMTVDNLTVRKTMSVFELLIQKVRATGGEIVVSPANGRIKKVTHVPEGEFEEHYSVEIESDDTGDIGNMFVVNDWVRCQQWRRNLTTIREYWARVSWVGGNSISLPAKYFDEGVAPEVGDELVLMGNQNDNSGRQGAISISAAANSRPRITVYDGIKGKNDNPPILTNCTKAVLGDLNGLTDMSFGLMEGYGLYSDNVYLKGEFHLKNGNTEVNIGDELTDIKSGEITLTSSKTTFEDSHGNPLAIFDDEGLKATKVQTIPSNGYARTIIEGSIMEVRNPNDVTNIRFGIENGYAVMKYYDNDGRLLYDLGPNGLQTIDVSDARFEAHLVNKLSDTPSAVVHDSAGAPTTVYVYYGKRVNSVYADDGAMTATLAAQANGKWFNHNSYSQIIAGGSLTDFTTGLFVDDGAVPTIYTSCSKSGDAETFKQEVLQDQWGLSSSDYSGIDFSVESDGETFVTPIKLQMFITINNGVRSTRVDIWQ